MAEQVGFGITVDKGAFEEVVQMQIKTALLESFKNQDQVVAQMVQQVLRSKCDSEGNPSRYDEKHIYIDVLLKRQVREAVKEALIEFLADKKELMRVEIDKALSKKAVRQSIANDLVAGLGRVVSNHWNLSVKVAPPHVEDDD